MSSDSAENCVSSIVASVSYYNHHMNVKSSCFQGTYVQSMFDNWLYIAREKREKKQKCQKYKGRFILLTNGFHFSIMA